MRLPVIFGELFSGRRPHPERARSDAEKRAVLDRVYAAWCRHPELRLGQLLVNVIGIEKLFWVEDTPLAGALESWRTAPGERTDDA